MTERIGPIPPEAEPETEGAEELDQKDLIEDTGIQRIDKGELKIKREQEARESQEARKKELVSKVLLNGGARMEAYLPAEYATRGSGGGVVEYDSKRKDSRNPNFLDPMTSIFQESLVTEQYIGTFFPEKGINEAIALVPMIKERLERIDTGKTRKKKRGLFKTEEVPIFTSEKVVEAIRHSDVVDKGIEEDAYKLIYFVAGKEYQNHTQRPGTTFGFEILLPESIAKEAFDQIKEDPVFARQIAKEVAIEKFAISEQAWEQGDEHTKYPLRPPYEKFRENQGGVSKMYIHEDVEGKVGFNPENIKEF